LPALTDNELGAILSQQVVQAADHDDKDLNGSRTKALDYYFGRMDEYVPPEPNRSKVVSRDVADVIGWIMPQLMRVFLASRNFAEAEPVEEDDVEWAKQATQGLNFVFFKDNDGEQVAYDVAWEALLFGDGIVKTYWDDTPQYAVSFHSGLTEDQRAMLLMPSEDGAEPEVLASSERQELWQDEMGQQVPVTVYDCKIRRLKAKGRFVVEAIPRGHYRKNASAKSPEDALFQSHVELKTRSELVEMGFDRKLVASIPTGGATRRGGEDHARDPISEDFGESATKATEEVELHECYAVIDVDDDGVAETVRAYLGGPDGSVLLDWELWEDESPFDLVQGDPIPHRFEGRSEFDQTCDVQDIKTVLERQYLNNLYASNNPQRFAKGKIANPEELTTPSFNGTVFGDANASLETLTVPMVAENALNGLAYQDEVVQKRTGVGRQSMALDPEALQNQSATANQNNKDAAYTQVEQIARNMSKGWRKMFRKLLKLLVKHQDTPRSVRLRGNEFVTIDPRHWNADMDITINVGLGTGSRDRDMGMLQQVLNNQLLLATQFMEYGATEQAIDMLPKVVETMTKIAESAGLRDPDSFYPENTEEIVAKLKEAAAQPKPDPALALEQAKGEVAKQLKQVDAQVAMHEAQLKAQGEVTKNEAELQADLQTREADRQNAIAIAQVNGEIDLQKQDRELAWKSWDAEQARQLEREKMANAAHIAAMKPDPKPSGAAAN